MRARAGLLPVQAVALGAAVQAGVLEGSVSGVMVMDIWQAALMRALAGGQLRADPGAAAQALGEAAAGGTFGGGDEEEEGWEEEEEAAAAE
jgi:molecular chaperone DnaK